MKLKSGVTFLAVLCVALAAPAYAAKITIGDQGGFVDVGAIVQTWARVIENGSSDRQNPSYDIYLRRMRFYVNGAINANIGIIANTDVSYSQGTLTNATGVVTNPVTAQNVVRFNSPTIVMNEALGYWTPCREFELMVGLQLVPWVHEAFTDITKFGSLDEQADVTQRGRPLGFQGRDRDMGIAFRGLLLNNIINYRIGVFNGVQTASGTNAYTTTGLVTGATNAAVNRPPYSTVNVGDSPSFNGFLRINIIGYEPGYAFCSLCNDGKAYFSIGGGANWQPRAIAAPAHGVPGATYIGYFADLFLNLPFGDNEFILEGGWVRNVYQGNGGPLVQPGANALINNAGNGYYGHVGVRFAWFYPYFAYENYQSNLKQQYVTPQTFLPFGPGGIPAGLVGNLTTYHAGLKFLLSPPPGNQFQITLDIAFQDKEQPSTAAGIAAFNERGNQWYGTLQFQWKI